MNRREMVIGGLALSAAAARGASPPPPAIADYERASGGHVGVYAEAVRTGRRLTWRADERFVMCSSFKASLAALVLRRVARGQDRLAGRIAFGPADIQDMYAPVARANLAKGVLTVGEMAEAAVRYSDNACANLLLARVGGPAALTAFWRGLGDATSRLDDPEPLLNRTPPGGVRDTTTPRAMAHTLRALTLGDALTPSYRTMLTGWLIGNTTGDNRLRAGLPRGWTTGDKTGNNGADAAADIAVTWPTPATPIVIAAYTRGGTPTPAHLDALFGAIGAMVAERLG